MLRNAKSRLKSGFFVDGMIRITYCADPTSGRSVMPTIFLQQILKAMKHKPYLKYYRVNQNDTTITPVFCNDFRPHRPYRQSNPTVYSLLPDQERYVGYADLVTAMKKAKAGALAYIDKLIKKGESGIPQLLQYRLKHYEDLNINLVEANISQVEERLQKDQNFKWHPYRISIQ